MEESNLLEYIKSFIDELKKKIQTLRLEAQIDTSEKDRLEGLLEIKKILKNYFN